MNRHRVITVGVLAVVVTAGAAAATSLKSGTGPHPTVGSAATAVATATVQRTDLTETIPVSGTVGYADRVTIVQPAGTTPQAVVQAQQSAAQAQLALSQAQATADQDRVAAARLALTNAQAAVAAAENTATVYDPTSKYTALPAPGQVVQPGQPLWSVDGRAVALLPGSLTPWRAFAPGMPPGDDVIALHQALIQLGFGSGLNPSAAFTGATKTAITRFQASLDLPRTGMLPLGSVVFEPGAVRVAAIHPLVGNTVVGGQPVLDVTSTTSVVNVALPVDQAPRVKVGDAVSVNLPDGSSGEGTITTVGTVATNTTPSDRGSNATSATVNVAVSLTKASAAGSFDQAPVTVNITNKAAQQVLAVPTTALLALAGGGYAVEVVQPDGGRQLVGVTMGVFDDQSGMVEVAGSGLAAGQQVVVAA